MKIRTDKIIAACFSTLLFLSGCETTSVNTTSSVQKKSSDLTVQELIRAGRTAEAKALFSSRAEINTIDEDGNTALHVAARINDADMVQFLLLKHASIDLKNNNGETPLSVAVKSVEV